MKKIFILLFSLFILCSCSNRKDYYVFSFDNYSLAVGYDDVEFVKQVFDLEKDEQLGPYETIDKIEIKYFNRYFADISVTNNTKKLVDIDKAIVTRFDFFLDNIFAKQYQIDDIVLSRSVKENCEIFDGELIEEYGYACIIGKVVEDKNNIIILHGDLFKIDQDELSRIEIYVE